MQDINVNHTEAITSCSNSSALYFSHNDPRQDESSNETFFIDSGKFCFQVIVAQDFMVSEFILRIRGVKESSILARVD